MFKNFSFPSTASAAPSQKSHTRHQPTSIPLPPNASEPLTPPLSPLHSPMPSPADASSCYSYFNGEHHDIITSTLFSLSLTPPPTADSPPENLEDVRRQRQLMARQQTSDEVLRELGELVKRVGCPSSRKGSTGSLVETSGIQKKSSASSKSVRMRARARGKRSEAVGQRVAA